MMLRVLNRKRYTGQQWNRYMLFLNDNEKYSFGTNSKIEMKIKLDLLGVKIKRFSQFYDRINGEHFIVYYADIELV